MAEDVAGFGPDAHGPGCGEYVFSGGICPNARGIGGVVRQPDLCPVQVDRFRYFKDDRDEVLVCVGGGDEFVVSVGVIGNFVLVLVVGIDGDHLSLVIGIVVDVLVVILGQTAVRQIEPVVVVGIHIDIHLQIGHSKVLNGAGCKQVTSPDTFVVGPQFPLVPDCANVGQG